MNKFFQRKIVNIFLPISFNICFGCSKEPSHRNGSFEYSKHMFWLRNKKINFRHALITKVLNFDSLRHSHQFSVMLRRVFLK